MEACPHPHSPKTVGSACLCRDSHAHFQQFKNKESKIISNQGTQCAFVHMCAYQQHTQQQHSTPMWHILCDV